MELNIAFPKDAAAIAREMDEQGFSVIENAIPRGDAAAVKRVLWDTARDLQRSGVSTHTALIDPNDANVRVYDLVNHDRVFLDLLTERGVLDTVQEALDGDFLVSNFTANIALPGALPMKLHSDMALVIPGPWHARWALNVIWCLDDIDAANGATRYLPGSHRFADRVAVPADADALTRPFEAAAGSAIVMDGRLWHTSGSNVTQDRERALLFAYYSRSFIRPQANWHEVLRAEVAAGLSENERRLFGFGPLANAYGSAMVRLRTS